MSAIVGCAAFAVACSISYGVLRRVRSRLGPTWEDWRYAEPIGGRWWPLTFAATAVLTYLGFYGSFLPGWVRAGILGTIAGVCAPFFAEGIRRWARRR